MKYLTADIRGIHFVEHGLNASLERAGQIPDCVPARPPIGGNLNGRAEADADPTPAVDGGVFLAGNLLLKPVEGLGDPLHVGILRHVVGRMAQGFDETANPPEQRHTGPRPIVKLLLQPPCHFEKRFRRIVNVPAFQRTGDCHDATISVPCRRQCNRCRPLAKRRNTIVRVLDLALCIDDQRIGTLSQDLYSLTKRSSVNVFQVHAETPVALQSPLVETTVCCKHVSAGEEVKRHANAVGHFDQDVRVVMEGVICNKEDPRALFDQFSESLGSGRLNLNDSLFATQHPATCRPKELDAGRA